MSDLQQRDVVFERPMLCLWGFMGTGKSTVGPLVAAAHEAAFVDLDVAIEAAAHKPITAIFREDGEKAFRAQERSLLLQTLAIEQRQVIALGGGALVDAEARQIVVARALLVTLTASLPEILKRTAASNDRPLRSNEASMQRLLTERSAAYNSAHFIMATDGKTPARVAAHLAKRWRPAFPK